jgi:Ca2+-binding RTX toxin-like protein
MARKKGKSWSKPGFWGNEDKWDENSTEPINWSDSFSPNSTNLLPFNSLDSGQASQYLSLLVKNDDKNKNGVICMTLESNDAAGFSQETYLLREPGAGSYIANGTGTTAAGTPRLVAGSRIKEATVIILDAQSPAPLQLGNGDDNNFVNTNSVLNRINLDGVNVIYAGGGNDRIRGGAGNDFLWGQSGNDQLKGETGDDVLSGDAGDDVLWGGNSTDTLFDPDQEYSPDQLVGYDYLIGGSGNDTLYGEAGVDILLGGTGNDVLDGGDGLDILIGGSGNDILRGGASSNTVISQYLDGGEGNDQLYGGSGRDSMGGGSGDDRLFGDAGDDYLSGDNYNEASGNDFLSGGAGIDSLGGGAGNDTLEGGTDNDELYGDAGNDTLNGGIGNDSLDGGLGTDILIGGEGNDRLNGSNYYTNTDTSQFDKLTGGAGNDDFILGDSEGVFYVETGDGYAIIQDWNPADDRIEVKGNLSQYSLEFNSVGGIGTNARDTEIYYTSASGARDRIAIIQDSTNISLSTLDFVVVS